MSFGDKNSSGGYGYKRAKTGPSKEEKNENDERDYILHRINQTKHEVTELLQDHLLNSEMNDARVSPIEAIRSDFERFVAEFKSYKEFLPSGLLRKYLSKVSAIEARLREAKRRIIETTETVDVLNNEARKLRKKIPNSPDAMPENRINQLANEALVLRGTGLAIQDSLVYDILAGDHKKVEMSIQDFRKSLKDFENKLPGHIPPPPHKSRGTHSA